MIALPFAGAETGAASAAVEPKAQAKTPAAQTILNLFIPHPLWRKIAPLEDDAFG
jgi:hypothetical protein